MSEQKRTFETDTWTAPALKRQPGSSRNAHEGQAGPQRGSARPAAQASTPRSFSRDLVERLIEWMKK